MKLTKLLLAALVAGSPFLLRADIGIGINIGVPVREAPPPPRVERMPRSPGREYVWIGGHWDHRRGRWEWIDGRWDRRPGYAWRAGHWDRRGAEWIWIDGEWMAAGPQPVAIVSPPPPPPPPQVTVVPGPPQGAVMPVPPGPPGVEVVVQGPPQPPMVVERMGRRPGREFAWVPGHYVWRGQWVWSPGEWRRHPHWHPGGEWVAGRWEQRGGGMVWIEGSWR